MRDDADEQTSNTHLEAYMLWLFGYVMFCGSQGDAVSRFLIPHTWRIADITVEEMPQINWGTAVSVATYRGLCIACVNTKKWYRRKVDLWAELGDEYHSARKNLLKGIGKGCLWSAMRHRSVEEVFGNAW
jgi:hypothetical protein